MKSENYKWPRTATVTCVAVTMALGALGQAGADELMARVPAVFTRATNQYTLLLQQCEGQEGVPRTVSHAIETGPSSRGKLVLVKPRDWTSGFFAGSLWQLYEYTGDRRWEKAAREYTSRLESIQRYTGSHDVGFMLNCSYGNGYRLTKDPGYQKVLIQGARSLSTRYKPEVGCIRSWDHGKWQYPVIIDNMMNLELLTWAAREGSEPRLLEIAIRHADNTLKHHFRPDASSVHVVEFNPDTGEVVKKQTHQGASDSSAWARGQAWALYGYTMMFRETRKPEYLKQACAIARFVMEHPRLPADKVPYWDFDAPDIPTAARDASAAAIMASALIELKQYADPDLGKRCLELARQQLLSLSSEAYLAGPGENGGFLLRHCVGNHPGRSEIDVPLNYADYYFLEALMRYRKEASAMRSATASASAIKQARTGNR